MRKASEAEERVTECQMLVIAIYCSTWYNYVRQIAFYSLQNNYNKKE